MFTPSQTAAGKDANVFIVSSAGGRATNLTRARRASRDFTATDISPDGKTILITSNAGNGYRNAGLLDIATKKITWLTSDKWEIDSGTFSPDGKRLTWTANVDGNQDIYLLRCRLETGPCFTCRQRHQFAAGRGDRVQP